MGGIWTSSQKLVGSLGELVGYKAGLALTRNELADYLDDGEFKQILLSDEDYVVRIRAEDYDFAVSDLLFRLGNIPTQRPQFPAIAVVKQFENDKDAGPITTDVLKLCIEELAKLLKDAPPNRALDPTTLIDAVNTRFGATGVRVALSFLETMNLALHASPWTPVRAFEWDDTQELDELFRSESLTTQYGRFLDQRFIDYLEHNFERIDDMNWRKFEGLAGEFFDRAGFGVEMGPGRGDGGIDIRIWPTDGDQEGPPLMVVQCKRQKDKVSQTIVKALWADTVDEGAGSGLIVTTSTLAPSAERVRRARAYQIDLADRETLSEWLLAMRTAGTGTFLA